MYHRESLSQILHESALTNSDVELSEALEAELSELDDLERASFASVMKGLRAAGQGATQGAAMGSVGGPWGAAIGGAAGAVMGGVGAATSSPASRRSAPRRAAPARGAASPAAGARPPSSPARPPRAAAPATPAPTAAPPTLPADASASQKAAAKLLWVIQSDTTRQALAAIVSGSLGTTHLKVADKTAAPAAFLTLIATLAAQALDQTDELASDEPRGGGDGYLRGDDGEYAWDPANPDARARALLQQLKQEARAHIPDTPPALTAESAGEWLVNAGVADLIPLRF